MTYTATLYRNGHSISSETFASMYQLRSYDFGMKRGDLINVTEVVK